MTRPPKDIGTQVRARLLRLAQERGEDFQLLLTRYANERLLHRLAVSPHGRRFVLKGGGGGTVFQDLHRIHPFVHDFRSVSRIARLDRESWNTVPDLL